MNLQTALSALKSAPTLEAAAAARLACLAAPDLDDMADWVEHKYRQRVAVLEREREAHARIDAREEARRATNEHKRALLASLEPQIPTAARDIRIRILRAELNVEEAFRAANEAAALALKTDDWATALALETSARAAVLELRRAEWARRCYRLRTGGMGALGGLTREDHLMVNPYTGRRS